MNILITAASRKVALVRYFSQGLKQNGIKGTLVTTDTDPLSPALYFSDKHFIVPLSTSIDYIPAIKDICRKEDITLVIPTIDEEIPLFGRYKDELKKDGITVLVSSENVGNICNDKYSAYNFFLQKDIPTPATFLPDEIDFSTIKYPLFIKPRFGRGSVNSYKIKNEKYLKFFIDYIDDPIVQDYLKGREFTIDVLSDFNGRVLSVVPRERFVIRAGVIDRGRTVKDQRLINYGVKIAEEMNIVGPSNIQCIVDEDDIRFIEINPRFSGGIQLTVTSGANFADMVINMANAKRLKPCIGDFKDYVTMVSYEESIYL